MAPTSSLTTPTASFTGISSPTMWDLTFEVRLFGFASEMQTCLISEALPTGDIKLFDFGLAKELHPSKRLPDGTYNLTNDTGSPRYSKSSDPYA
jgi:hypothetical protein